MGKLLEVAPRDLTMHDLIIALAFVGMIVAPAVVAAKSTAATDDSDYGGLGNTVSAKVRERSPTP